MTRYLLGRLAQGLLVLWALFTITFFLTKAMPGDPFEGERDIPEDIKESLRAQYRLDEPAWKQYVVRLGQVCVGDPGYSISKKRPVLEIIRQSFPVSATLGVIALGIALLIGVPSGVAAALWKGGPIDFLSMGIAMVGICVPAFVVGPLLQTHVAMRVPFLTVAGWNEVQDVLLPAFTLGLATAAYLARLTRSGMLEVLSQDYIRTARAKGLSPIRTVVVHALRGGLVPAVAYIGPAFAMLITGSFIVETIFQVPGMGRHFVTGALARDEFLMVGISVFYGFLIVLANLGADVLLAWLNPRVRLAD
jgi:oligopeptide transport system permease protein